MTKKYILTILIVLLCANVYTQETEESPQKDLKVGLVLSGGGAKGFAHVGVLKVLEQIGVRIDYIGGTSMGAIVGALYATGYTASQIDSIIHVTDFEELMQDKIPRKTKTFFQKDNADRYAFKLPIKNKKVVLPTAISKGQNIFNMLSHLTRHVHQVESFDKLPIPYFCIATAIETGKQQILEEGFLPLAIQASASFPTLLDPVTIDGVLLTDGGVVNNYPVNVMKDKGVDVIIGVDLQEGLISQGNVNSIPKVLMQLISYQMVEKQAQNREDTDVYLHIDLPDYNVVSFDAIDEILAKGEEVALSEIVQFENIVKQQIKREVRKPLHNNFSTINTFKEILISGNEHYTDEYVLSKINLDTLSNFSHNQIHEGINRLVATGNFDKVQYKFLTDSSGKTILDLKLKENEISTFVKLSAHYDEIYKTAILANLTSKHLLFDNDVFSFDFMIGDNFRYQLDYFIDNGFYWSYGLSSKYTFFKRDFFINDFSTFSTQGNTKSTFNYNDFTTNIYLQTKFRNKALRLGMEHQYLDFHTEVRTTQNEIVKEYVDNSAYLNAFGTLFFDSFDNNYFPKSGLKGAFTFKSMFLASELSELSPLSLLSGRISYAHTIKDRLSFELSGDMGLSIGDKSFELFEYYLGGTNQNFINTFVPFYGYEMATIQGRDFIKGMLKTRYEIIDKNHVSFIINYANVGDDILSKKLEFDELNSGYGFSYGIDSFMGPIELIYTWSPEQSSSLWYINVGFWF